MICMLQERSIGSFLKGYTVFLALTVSVVWLLAGYDYFRKKNIIGALLWGGIAILILLIFIIHDLLSWKGSWTNVLLPTAGIIAEAALMRNWLRQADRTRPK